MEGAEGTGMDADVVGVGTDVCGGDTRALKVIFEERELEDFGAFAKYS